MRKIGVVQVIDSLAAGGAEVLAVNIANVLSEKGINSHLCATRGEGPLIKNIAKNTGYICLNRRKKLDILAIIKFKKYIKMNNINIIHAHSTSSFFAFCIKMVQPKIKIIWHDHYGKSQELNVRKLFPINIFSLFFTAIISVNSSLKKWAEKKLLCKRVYFLNNFAIFNNHQKETRLYGNDYKRIVHLASFRPQKDHQNLINAFDLFLKKNQDWSLHLVGKIYDDEYTKEIIDSIKNKKLEKNIFMYDVCLDIEHILSQATIAVLSSKSEGLPIAVLEYGLAKLPVVVTNVGECNKVVENNISGIVVEKENYLELAKAMQKLVIFEEKREEYATKHHHTIIKNILKKTSQTS